MNMFVRDGIWKRKDKTELSGELSGKRLWSCHKTEETMNELINYEWMNERMNEQMDERMNEW